MPRPTLTKAKENSVNKLFHGSAGTKNAGMYHSGVATLKKKVIGVTSDILSAPARMKANRVIKQADSDVKILKEARAYDNAPNFNDDGSVTDAFKVRSLASDVKDRLKKKK